MGLLGFFNYSFQDDSKRPLVNKWLETLEPPDQQSLLELEYDFDRHHYLSSTPSTPSTLSLPASDIISSMMSPPVQRHYDMSQVAVSAWQDPFQTYDTTPYDNSWQDTQDKSHVSHGYQRTLAYQVSDQESTSDEEEDDEEEDDDDIRKFLNCMDPDPLLRTSMGSKNTLPVREHTQLATVRSCIPIATASKQ